MPEVAELSPSTNSVSYGVSPCAKAPVFLMNSDLSTGGTERQFSLMARCLRESSFTLYLGCMRRRGAWLEEIGEIAEFDVGGSFFTPRAQRARGALAQQFGRKSIAVAHSFDFYSNMMLIPVARWARVPVVVGSMRNLGDLLAPRQRAALLLLFRLCTRVVCNSQAAAASLRKQGLPNSKIEVIPNGLPEEAFHVPGLDMRQDDRRIRIGLIARMNHRVKNQGLFLRAAACLAPRFPEAEFVVVGDGPYRQELEALAGDLRIAHQTKFLGEKRNIQEVMATLDVSVLTSDSESLSNVVLESMAAGRPVIATRVGGNVELVREGETGLLIPPRNVQALANALETLVSKPALRLQMGQRARTIARTDYSLHRIRGLYEQLYTSLLEEKHWKPGSQVQLAAQMGSKRLSVAIVAPSLERVGGQAVQANLLMRNWEGDKDVEATFVPIDPKLPRCLGWVQRIPYVRTLMRMPVFLVSLWRAMSHVETVHIFSASYASFLLRPAPAWMMAHLRGKKSLINYRSGEAPDHLQKSRVARSILRYADEVVVPSQYLADVFRQHNLSTRVVPNIVDLTQFAYRDRIPLGPSLICTRMFEPYYQVDVVLHAFAEVAKTFPEASLCLVGGGSQEQGLRAIAARLNLRNLEFAGVAPRNRIARYYDRADIFINASRLDNMPVSILEAFASGTCVVTTAPQGIRYLVDHERTGLLCEPGNWRALAQNVIRLLQDRELAFRLARNAKLQSSSYGWDSVRTQWLELYQSLGNRREWQA